MCHKDGEQELVTEHSSLLDMLVSCDTVLADHEFDIQDSVGSHYSRLAIPTFTKGTTQLSRIDVEQSRQIANLVECVIGNIRQKNLPFE